MIRSPTPAAWRVLAVVQLVAITALGAGLALWWQPEPHGDWAYYWAAAGDPSLYQRGGLSLWILAIPKALGLSPVLSALALNLPSAAVVLFLAYRAEPGPWRILAQAVVAYLLLITPYAGIVQLDLIAAAQMGLGFWLLLDPSLGLRPRARNVLALSAVAMAVSTRPQFALTLWALVGMALVAWLLLRKRWHPMMNTVLGVLLLGSTIGFGVDSGLRQISGRTAALRTSSAVTLYSGLLVSRLDGCGHWSLEAAQAARADLGKPLAIAVRDRLAAKPLSHWWSIVRCKWPHILQPRSYALYWLIESPNIREGINASSEHARIDGVYYRLIEWERTLHDWVTLTILLICAWTLLRTWRVAPALALLPPLWVASFWVVHIVFEIQGRYFLGMFLLAPMVSAWVMAVSQRQGPVNHVTVDCGFRAADPR